MGAPLDKWLWEVALVQGIVSSITSTVCLMDVFHIYLLQKLHVCLEKIRNKRKEAGDGRLKKHEFITHFSWNGLSFEVKWSDWLTILFKGFYWTGSKAKRFTWLVRSKPVIVLPVRGMGQSWPLFLFLTVLKRLKNGPCKNTPMTGFEPWPSGGGNDRTTNWATTTACHILHIYRVYEYHLRTTLTY